MEEKDVNENKKKNNKNSLASVVVILLIIIIAETAYIIITGNKEVKESDSANKVQNNIENRQDNTENEIDEEAVHHAMKMQSFNSQFASYCGRGLTASQIRSLLSNIISSNMITSSSEDEPLVMVKIEKSKLKNAETLVTVTKEAEEIKKIQEQIKEEEKFTVEMEYNENGYVNIIDIK